MNQKYLYRDTHEKSHLLKKEPNFAITSYFHESALRIGIQLVFK